MARSVSYATNSVWVLYAHLEEYPPTFCCTVCGLCVEDAEMAPTQCAGCGHGQFRHEPADADDLERDDFCGNLRAAFEQAYPSLAPCDKWLDREDYALLENRLVHIGISQYFQLVSLWCVPKPSAQWGRDTAPLAEWWAASIEDRAASLLDQFAVRLIRVGTMSNGEGVFRSIAPCIR